MLKIEQLHDVYCDAVVDEAGLLLFLSCWGRDTSIQELIARLTLPGSEGGLSHLTLIESEHRFEPKSAQKVLIGHPDRLNKLTGRLPKANLFGDLVHCWLFDQKIAAPDFVNQQAILLFQAEGQLSAEKLLQQQWEPIWSLIKAVCPLPLIDRWQETLIALLLESKWLNVLEGYRIHAVNVNLPDEFELKLQQLIQDGVLTLNA